MPAFGRQCAHFRRALLQRFQLCSGLRLPPLTGAACTEVHNARLLDPAPTLDSHGFQLVEAPTELDLQDTDQVTGAFYAECRALIERATLPPDTLALLFTSGTTGVPKVALLPRTSVAAALGASAERPAQLFTGVTNGGSTGNVKPAVTASRGLLLPRNTWVSSGCAVDSHNHI